RGFERPALDVVKLPDDMTDALRRLKHGGCVHQRLGLAGLGIFPALPQDADHRLADGKVAGRGDRHDALPRTDEDVELSEGRDVAHPTIGAGVGDHQETAAPQDAAEIGHDVRPAPSPAVLYPAPGGNPAMLSQFWICGPACSMRTLIESASPAPP